MVFVGRDVDHAHPQRHFRLGRFNRRLSPVLFRPAAAHDVGADVTSSWAGPAYSRIAID